MTTLGSPAFQLELDERAADGEEASPDARTLVSLRILSHGRNLTQWTDWSDKQLHDALPDIPLVDLAFWFASSWDELVFGLLIPPEIAARQFTPARRWGLSGSSVRKAFYDWASVHALEFAASDFAVPNVVFRRRDDFMEVSWDPRPSPGPGSSVIFDAKPGSVLVGVSEFVSLLNGVLDWVIQRCPAHEGDERLRAIRKVRDRGALDVGRAALSKWFPDLRLPTKLTVPETDLALLGISGTAASPAVMFLRSAAGVARASEASKLLALVPRGKGSAFVALSDLASGLDSDIDPERPWDSGLRLARIIRSRLKISPSHRLDIAAVLEDLHVRVEEHEFAEGVIEGACFLSASGAAAAFYNPRGRLSRWAVGRRTTLAHELCHLLFDAPQRVLGQLDLRVGSSGASLIEMRANAFAAELLLPREVVLAEAIGDRLSRAVAEELARRFHVSIWVVSHQTENQALRIA